MDILVTGGAGYIGSHTVIELVAAGYSPVVVDNFSNSKPESLKRVSELCGQHIPVYDLDINDKDALREVFARHQFAAVVHFAGLKAVGESCEKPLWYYQNNVAGSMALAEVMAEHELHTLIFSSSATVYGDPDVVPISEQAATSATNPYGSSKLMVETLLQDMCSAPQSPWRVCLLRYFNPIGAHSSGQIGEDPNGIPNNLLPYIAQVAVGKLEQLQIFGGDYSTVDGTGVRDYIHVVDLAKGHVASLKYLLNTEPACEAFNLGTGQGYSVLQVLAAFEKASDKPIPYQIAPRRKGDVAQSFSDPAKSLQCLAWRAEHSLDEMVADTWRWQMNNPNGYE